MLESHDYFTDISGMIQKLCCMSFKHLQLHLHPLLLLLPNKSTGVSGNTASGIRSQGSFLSHTLNVMASSSLEALKNSNEFTQMTERQAKAQA